MKDDKTIDKLLKTISYKIIEFEDGDIILISELIDDINSLKYLLKDNNQVNSVLNIALSVLNKLLNRKEIQKPDIILTDSIDLLSKIIETSDKADKKSGHFLDSEIDTFLFTYKYLKDEELENKMPEIDKEKIRINELSDNLQNTIAQDEATSIVYGMPKEAIDLGAADTVMPIDKIVDVITQKLS